MVIPSALGALNPAPGKAAQTWTDGTRTVTNPSTIIVAGGTISGADGKTVTVTPTGGGGSTALSGTAITANGQVGSIALPANGMITLALFRETAGHAVNVSLGTTLGGSDILAAQAVPADGTLTVDVTAFAKNWFSASATQAIYITSASWGSASVNVSLPYVGGP